MEKSTDSKEKSQIDKNKAKLSKAATIIGCSAAVVGIGTAGYALLNRDSYIISSEELECRDLEALAETVNDPEADAVAIENASWEARMNYMFGADTDGDGIVDQGEVYEDAESQAAYDAISAASEFGHDLSELGPLTAEERQPAPAFLPWAFLAAPRTPTRQHLMYICRPKVARHLATLQHLWKLHMTIMAKCKKQLRLSTTTHQ